MAKVVGQIYKTHKNWLCKFLDGTVDDCRELAEIAAKQKQDGLYRFFGPDGFVTSFSSLDGKVTEHKDVTIPAAHW